MGFFCIKKISENTYVVNIFFICLLFLFFAISNILFFIIYSVKVVSISFSPLPPSTEATVNWFLPTVNPFSIVHAHESFIHVIWLSPFPFLPQFPPPSSPSIAISLFHVCMSLFLFFSFVYFVHEIPVVSEATWCLCFANRLISLSDTLSSYIHAVAKGWTFSFISVA